MFTFNSQNHLVDQLLPLLSSFPPAGKGINGEVTWPLWSRKAQLAHQPWISQLTCADRTLLWYKTIVQEEAVDGKLPWGHVLSRKSMPCLLDSSGRSSADSSTWWQQDVAQLGSPSLQQKIIGHQQFKTGINSCASSTSSNVRKVVAFGIQGTGVSKMNVQILWPAGRTQRTLAAQVG